MKKGLHVTRFELGRSDTTPGEWFALVIVRMLLFEVLQDPNWKPKHVGRYVAELVCATIEERMPPDLEFYYIENQVDGEPDGRDYIWCAKVKMREGSRGVLLEKSDAEWDF